MNLEIPNELLIEIARENCFVFVGSGPSTKAGFPDWHRLLRQMIEWSVINGINIPNESEITHLIDNKRDFLAAADAIRAGIGESNYRRVLEEIFNLPNVSLTEFHQLVGQIPFSAAATTNFERLLEESFKVARPGKKFKVFTQVDHQQLGTALHSKEFFVLKAHGTIDRPDTIVLGKNDYIKLIHKSEGYRTFLKALFLNRTVLFLGFSMTDPELLLLLEELKGTFEGHVPSHYALMDISGTTKTEQNNFELYYGVKIIPYIHSSEDHPEVAQFLRTIIAKLPKYIISHAVTNALGPAKDILNADSHYRLVMDTDNRFVIKEKYDGASKDKPLTFSMQFRFDSKNPEDREAHERLKKLLAIGEPVTIKSPHLAKFIPPNVLSVLMPEQLTEMQVTMGPVIGQNTLRVRAILEANNGERITFENIELKNIQGGSEQMILSNQHQDVPWKLRQIIRFDEDESPVNFTFELENVPIMQAVKALKFCRAFSSGGHLKIESEETGLQLSHAEVPPGSFPLPDEQWIQICEYIELIQRKTSTPFNSPKALSGEDARQIFVVSEILKTGKATMMPPLFEVSRDEAQDFLKRCSLERPLSLSHYSDEWVSIVLGQRVSLGPVLITGARLHIAADDIEIARQRLESGGESIPIRLTPVPGTVIEARYPQWLPKEEADAVVTMPFVRKTSLNNLINALFEASRNQNGGFDTNEFFGLLESAREESLKNGILINPLKTATHAEINEALSAAAMALEEDTRAAVIAKFLREGWFNEPMQDSATAA